MCGLVLGGGCGCVGLRMNLDEFRIDKNYVVIFIKLFILIYCMNFTVKIKITLVVFIYYLYNV